MKIEELIKKTGDKLISQKDKLAYFMAVKKLELIAKIPDKKQRSEAMGKFKDILAKKVTPVVMAALTAISPVVLSGCDETTKNPSDTQVAYVTDTNGEYVTGENGEPLITEITTSTTNGEAETEIETEKERAEDELRKLSTDAESKLNQLLNKFNIEDVINGKYVNALNEMVENVNSRIDDESIRNDSDYTNFIHQSVLVKDAYKQYLRVINKLTEPSAKYCVDIDVPRDKSGTKIQYYRDGEDTAVFIITTKDSEGKDLYFYNGVVKNEVYTDGLEFLPDIPFVLTDDEKSIITQLSNKENLGALWGNSLVSFACVFDNPFVTNINENEEQKQIFIKHGGCFNSEGGKDITKTKYSYDCNDLVVFYNDPNTQELDGPSVNNPSCEVKAGFNFKYYATWLINVENEADMDKDINYFLSEEDIEAMYSKTSTMKEGNIVVTDEEGYSYIIANLEFDYAPENIKLPVSENEEEVSK